MNVNQLAEPAYELDQILFDHGLQVAVESSEQDLELLIEVLPKAVVEKMVRTSRHLQKHVFPGRRPNKLPKDANRKLARDIQGNMARTGIVLMSWFECNNALLNELRKLEISDPSQTLIHLVSSSGQRDWRKLLWALKLDPRLAVQVVLGAGLSKDLHDPDSQIRRAIDNAHLSIDIEEHPSSTAECDEALVELEDTKDVSDIQIGEQAVVSLIVDSVSEESLDTNVVYTEGPVTTEVINALFDAFDSDAQRRGQLQNTLSSDLGLLARLAGQSDLSIGEFEAARIKVFDIWMQLVQSSRGVADSVKEITNTLLDYLRLSIPAPELKEVTFQLHDLVPTIEFDRLDMPQQWVQALHDKWVYIGSTIQDYVELQSQLQQTMAAVIDLHNILRESFGTSDISDTEIRLLADWETKIERWKELAPRALTLLRQLQSELAQKKQTIKDRIVEMRALIRPVVLEYAEEFSNEWDISGLLEIDYTNMDLESLVSLNTTLEQASRYAQTLTLPASPEELDTILDEISADSSPGVLLERRPEPFLGHFLLKAARFGVMPSSRLWLACRHAYAAVLNSSKRTTGFYATYGYSIIAAALRTYIDQQQIKDALGFIDFDFLPSSGAHAVWSHAEVSLVLDDERILALTKYLARHTANDTIPSAAVLTALIEVAEAKDAQSMTRLALAATLLSVAQPRSSEYAVGATELLRVLNSTERFGSALFAWKAIYQLDISAISEEQLIALFQGVFDRLHDSPIVSDLETLDQMCADLFWAAVETGMQNLLAVVGLASFALYQKEQSDVRRDLALQFVAEIGIRYSSLASRMMRKLRSEPIPSLPDSSLLHEKEQQLKVALQDLDREMREHSVRNWSVAKEIQKDNLEKRFLPLANLLKSDAALPAMLLEEVDSIDPESLITQHPAQRAASRDERVKHPVLGEMIQYNQKRIMCLHRAVELHLQLAEIRKANQEQLDEFESARQDAAGLMASLPSSCSIALEAFGAIAITL